MKLGEIFEELKENHDYNTVGSHLVMCFSEYNSIEDVPNEEFKTMLQEYLYSLELGTIIENLDSSVHEDWDDFGFE